VKKLFLNILWLFITLSVANSWGFTAEDCIWCHKTGSSDSSLRIDVEVFNASIHGREITCLDCHTDIRNKDHETIKRSKLVDCNICHDVKNSHAQAVGSARRPQCFSCHTKHAIFTKENELSTINPKNLKKTCSSCHPTECGDSGCLSSFVSFRISSHKKGNFSHSFSKEMCLGCHQGRGAHGKGRVLTHDDCYKCHISLAGDPLLIGYIHSRENINKSFAIDTVKIVYLLFTLLLFFGGFIFYSKKFSQITKQSKGKNRC
jgi:hypothetical protein